MGAARELGERMWRGGAPDAGLPGMLQSVGLEELAPGLAFVGGFGNVSALDTPEGLVVVDTGSAFTGPLVAEQLRTWSSRPLHTVIFTHGHVDHVMGIGALEAASGRARVVAHEAVPARFERYRLTAGYNAAINARQFGFPGLVWPTEYRAPDLVYRTELELEVGGERLLVHHARGETDDHSFVWSPARRALMTGDLFIWASPNCGNPQKVQRYPREWAAALRRMQALGAETLLPGHGPPIEGADRVEQALSETAELLETLHDQTVAAMNEGARLEEVVARVHAPARLLERPYLRPVYDDPRFIVRNLWRLYGGWWDGEPAHLEPAPEQGLGLELAALAGGAGQLAARATELSREGRHALACQLAEWAARAAPEDAAIRRARAEAYRLRAAGETSLMARSIYLAAADEKPR